MRGVFSKLFMILICLITIFVFMIVKPSIVISQAIDVGGDAPNTTDVVNDALANGASPEEAAQAGADYLNSQGYDAHVEKQEDGTVSVVCNNGSQVDIPPPPPPPEPDQPPPPPPPPPPPEELQAPPQDTGGEEPAPPPEPEAESPPVGGPPPDENPPEEPPPPEEEPPIEPTNPPTTRTPSPTRVSTLTPTRTPSPTRTPTPTPTLTPTPTNTPTPTPTPFNAAACKCDGIEHTDLFSGQIVTITSFGKVEGADTSKAIVKDQSFFLAEGAETIARIIGRSGPISSVVVPSTPDKVRFQSKWTFTLPQLKSGATYRIWSQVNCQPKLQALNYSPAGAGKAVLATSTTTEPRSFIQRMIDFLNGLFGGGPSSTKSPSPTPSDGVGTGIILEEPESTGNKSLQLGTVYPVEVYDKSCSFIKFRSDQLSQ